MLHNTIPIRAVPTFSRVLRISGHLILITVWLVLEASSFHVYTFTADTFSTIQRGKKSIINHYPLRNRYNYRTCRRTTSIIFPFKMFAGDNHKNPINTLPSRNSNDEQWWNNYNALKKHKQIHGDCLVPAPTSINIHSQEYSNLYKWVIAQRQYYRKQLMKAQSDNHDNAKAIVAEIINSKRYQALVQINFIWNVYEYKWECNLRDLEEYYSIHHHCNVPSSSKLGKWVASQRRDYEQLNSNTSSSHLTPERIRKLEALNFEWYPDKNNHLNKESWDYQYKKLVRFSKKNGHCNIATSCTSPSSISIWMKTQRTLFRQNKLHPNRVKKLNQLNFEWDPTTWKTRLANGDDQWNARLEQLKAYKAKYGDCYVPQHYRGSSGKSTLGHWVDKQRQIYRQWQVQNNNTNIHQNKMNSTITPSPLIQSRIEKLDAIGFEWSAKHKMNAPRDRLWYQRLEDLIQYKKQHGNCLVPLRYGLNPKLGRWVVTQRQQYHLKKIQDEEGVEEGKMKSMMTEERMKTLEELGFVWIVRPTRRKRRYRSRLQISIDVNSTKIDSKHK